MKKLSKELAKRRDEIMAKLEELSSEVEMWKTDVSGEIQSYIDDRSDAWREGERGDAFQSWLDEFECFDESPLSDMKDAIENLPTEPGQ